MKLWKSGALSVRDLERSVESCPDVATGKPGVFTVVVAELAGSSYSTRGRRIRVARRAQ